jgi:hypothetical protein
MNPPYRYTGASATGKSNMKSLSLSQREKERRFSFLYNFRAYGKALAMH